MRKGESKEGREQGRKGGREGGRNLPAPCLGRAGPRKSCVAAPAPEEGGREGGREEGRECQKQIEAEREGGSEEGEGGRRGHTLFCRRCCSFTWPFSAS